MLIMSIIIGRTGQHNVLLIIKTMSRFGNKLPIHIPKTYSLREKKKLTFCHKEINPIVYSKSNRVHYTDVYSATTQA